jgi:hypothetical protein
MAKSKTRNERLAVAVAVLGETFGRQVTAVTIQAYEMGLDGIAIDAIERAVKRASGECRFMPVPSELRELAGEMPAKDRAIRAWSAAMRGVRLHGYYHSVNFDDPIINATIRSMGGWERFAERLEVEEEKWLRRDFEAIYVSFATRGVSAEACEPLGGFLSRSNGAAGYLDAVPEPVLVECGLPPHPAGVLPSPAQKRIGVETRELVDSIGRIPE